MNGSRALARELAQGVREGASSLGGIDVLLCPSFVHLAEVGERLEGSAVALGAQDVNEHEQGAHTGEVAADMLREYGCRYAIVGHSERRHVYRESNERVAAKFARAQAAGLIPILCVGEQLEEREGGRTEQVIAGQLAAVLDTVGPQAFRGAVVAYEPVWAIGTGRTASPEQAQEVHAFIRRRLAESDSEGAAALQILYGGSVKADNAAGLFAQPDVNGGLIGGASLKLDAFLAICQAAAQSGSRGE